MCHVLQAQNHMKIISAESTSGLTHSSFLRHVYVETLSLNRVKEMNRASKKIKTEVSFTNWKNQRKPHIKLLEASLGSGLGHTVIFHHKMLKMDHRLWHVLSSLATLHLTRSKTKKKSIFTK